MVIVAVRPAAFARIVRPTVRAQYEFEQRIRASGGTFERRATFARFALLGLGIVVLAVAAVSTAILVG